MAKAMLLGAGGWGGGQQAKLQLRPSLQGPLQSLAQPQHLLLSPEQTGSGWTLPAALGGKMGKAEGELGAMEDAVFPFRSSAS